MLTLALASRTFRLGALLLLSAAHAPSVAHAQECSSDEDCPSGMGCDFGGASSPPCASGEDCPPPDAPTEGYCDARPIECTESADCPAGLLCVEQQGGDAACASSPDGGTTCEEPEDEPAISECSFVREECESDDDCTQEGFACLTMGGAESCSSAVPACDRDGNCPDASEPECEVETETRCFPARVDCDQDTDCAEDWVCYALREEAGDEAGEFAGATEVCFPEGLVLALDEQIELGDADDGGGATSSSADRASTTDNEESSDDGAPAPGSSIEAGDDGCAVSTPGSEHRGSSGLVLLGLLTLLLRARKRG